MSWTQIIAAIKMGLVASAESVANIINGTTKVGNADKLDGNDSTYFATAASVINITNGTTTVPKADTLDGYHASDLLRNDNYREYVRPWTILNEVTGDFNTMLTRGDYLIGNSMANNPYNSNGGVFYGWLRNSIAQDTNTHNRVSDWLLQEYTATGGERFYRTLINADDFTPWKECLHTGNSTKVIVSTTAPADTTAVWIVP